MTTTPAATLKDFLWRLEQSSGHDVAQKLLDDNPDLEQMLQTAETPSHDSTPGEFATAAELLRTARFTGAMTATPAVAVIVRARQPLTEWLGCLAMLTPAERKAERDGDRCGWCGVDHALDIARALNGGTR